MHTKTCYKCRAEKPLECFYFRKLGASHSSRCKACISEDRRLKWELQREKLRAVNKDQYAKNPKIWRDKDLLRTYGITSEQYSRMREKQHGVCAICKKPEPVKNRDLSVDHDHGTKKIRALLCTKCNRGLGLFCDDFQLLVIAARYLHEHKGVI